MSNYLQQISSQATMQRLSVETFLARFIENSFTDALKEAMQPKSIFRELRNQAFQQNINQLSLEEINAEVKNRRGEKD